MDWKYVMDELLKSKASAGIAILIIGYFFGDEGLKYFMGLDPEMRTQIVNGAVALSAVLMGWSRAGSAKTKQELESKVVNERVEKQDIAQELADAKRIIALHEKTIAEKEEEVDSLKKSPPSKARPSRAKKVEPKK